MGARFVLVDHDTPLLMPPDLREWVPEDHLVHFIMEAVGLIDLREAKINERGTGSPQYPPALMLGLLDLFLRDWHLQQSADRTHHL